LIHELGHVFVNWRKGLKATAPMFIPFIGAVIFLRRFPDDPTTESESGAGGPAAGLLASLACALIGAATHDRFWFALANISFLINLFNLIPFPPLDGSHIAAVFSPATWNFVLVALLLWVIKVPSPLIWFVLVIGFIFRLGRQPYGRHNLATPAVRARMALVYVGLCLALAYGADRTASARELLVSRSAATASGASLSASADAGAS